MDDGRYFGKYRGKVTDNIDPLEIGRLLVDVPQLAQLSAGWAMPCVPYAGPQVGFCLVPPIGAMVWVEFEGGHVQYPIWVGCFWSEGERPTDMTNPSAGGIQTETTTLRLDDTPETGGVALVAVPPAVDVPSSVRLDVEGIRAVTAGTIDVTVEGGLEVNGRRRR